ARRFRGRGGLCLTARRFRRGQRRGLCNRRHCSVSGGGRSGSGRGRSVSGRASGSGRGRRRRIGNQRAAKGVARELEVRTVRESDGDRCPVNGKDTGTLVVVDFGRIEVGFREANCITTLKALNLLLKIGRIV